MSVVDPVGWKVFYPPMSAPLLASLENPGLTAFLPECAEKDYVVSKHPVNGKAYINSMSTGYCKYVTCPMKIV